MNIDALRDLERAGVRWELGETPVGARTSTATNAPSPAMTTDVPGMRPGPTVVPACAPITPPDAQMAANAATDINALAAAIGAFNHPLRTTAGHVVLPHVGTPGGLMIITDTPGAEDDATGRILSGPAGDMMDKMMAAIGLGRDVVSIVPLVFWRTPGGRTPTREELDLAHPFVARAIDLIGPRVILTLGTLPASEIAGRSLPREHGMATQLPSGALAMPIFHPNYLLLKPDAKRDVWTALQSVQNMLKDPEK